MQKQKYWCNNSNKRNQDNTKPHNNLKLENPYDFLNKLMKLYYISSLKWFNPTFFVTPTYQSPMNEPVKVK